MQSHSHTRTLTLTLIDFMSQRTLAYYAPPKVSIDIINAPSAAYVLDPRSASATQIPY